MLLQVLQNGVDPEPSLFADPTFTVYNLAAVHVTQLVPPGGPAGVETTITVVGSGFAEYGKGQLICRVGNLTSTPGILLDSERILCTVPQSTCSGVVELAVSLNNGTAGTFTQSLPFVYYAPPHLAAIYPLRGSAEGGTNVTVHGTGFTALSTNPSVRAQYLSCLFGVQALPVSAVSHNDTTVVCTTQWGTEDPVGQPVQVALNAQSFETRASDADSSCLPAPANMSNVPRFQFVGLNPPTLLEAYFPAAGTTLVIRFDSQPTNRGGMNGIEPCSVVLDDQTSAQLRGSAAAEAKCAWADDSTLFVRLTLYTAAAPGMRIGIRSDVLWPKEWNYPGTCAGESSKCAKAAQVVVDADFPCDLRGTKERELCIQPIALIQAPTEISSCSGSTLNLDASRSSGSGIKPLTYSWSASPRTCDNYCELFAMHRTA